MIVSPPMRTSFDSTYMGKVQVFKHAVAQLPEVIAVSTSSHVPGSRPYRTFGIKMTSGSTTGQHTMSQLIVDEDFFKMYQVKLLAGRMFETTDCSFDWNKVNKVIINRSALNLLEQSIESIIGRELTVGDKVWTIIGVVENFHQQSLHSAIEPMLFTPDYGVFNPTSIKLSGSNYQNAVQQIQKISERVFPDNAFNYSFLENTFQSQYLGESRFRTILNLFTTLAVIISCLGLVALASHSAKQRTKEIGIRKVLGASVRSIIALLSVDLIRLILLSTILSVPVVFFAMQSWLMNYSYRVSLGVVFFAIPMVAVLTIAAITIVAQVFETARTNPVDSLKHE
jgi:putative ABC transport system permease protein